MQMTSVAALAILAFISSVAAYYPTEGFASLYAREAYAEPEAELVEIDDFQIYSRDAEPEWDIHPRDAYIEGFELGLQYAKRDDPKKTGAKKTTANQTPGKKKPETPQQKMQGLNAGEQPFLRQDKKDQAAEAKEKKEIAGLEKQERTQLKQVAGNTKKITSDNQQYNNLRTQQLTGRSVYDLDDVFEWDY